MPSTPTATIFLPYHALDDVIQRGTRAAQPAAVDVVPGTLYCVTDESNRLERSDGTAWALYAPTGGGGGGGAPDPHHATHEPGGSDTLVDVAWTDVANVFTADQTVDGDLVVTGTVNPLTTEQRDRINALVGQPGGARMVMSQNYAAGLSLRHEETLSRARIACGNYDTQTYQPLAFEVEALEVHTGVSPAARVEHVRVHALGGVTVGVGTDHDTDPGVGILKARGLDGTPLDATFLLTGTLPDARLSANVQLKPIAATDLPVHHTRHEPGGADALAVDAAAATGSLRTLGTGANQAAPGNDARFTAPSAPTAHKTTHEPGGSDALTALSASILTTGTLPDARLSANVQLKPIAAADLPAHATRHQPGGADALAVDAAAATGSLRTLGTSATSACAGNDSRLTNTRTPTAHKTTHEPGGSDALTALSASILTTGTLPDARLSANVARRDQDNTFTGYLYNVVNGPGWYLLHSPGTVNARAWAFSSDGALFGVFPTTDDFLTVQANPLTCYRTGNVAIGADVLEKGRSTAIGHWINVPNSPGNFTTTGGGTLVVATYFHQGYTLIGKTCIYNFYLQLTITGTPTALHIALPSGIIAATYIGTAFAYSALVGSLQVLPADTKLTLRKDVPGTAWAAGTHYMTGSITFQIQ